MWERDDRSAYLLTATVENGRLGEIPIVVRNMSSRGIGARMKDKAVTCVRCGVPQEGEEIIVKLGDAELIGKVSWVRGVRFGIYVNEGLETSSEAFAKARASSDAMS
jgi:hypothetical protein